MLDIFVYDVRVGDTQTSEIVKQLQIAWFREVANMFEETTGRMRPEQAEK
jgi:hypothetical protein